MTAWIRVLLLLLRLYLLLLFIYIYHAFLLNIFKDDWWKHIILKRFKELLNGLILTLEVYEKLPQMINIVQDQVVNGDGVLFLHAVSLVRGHCIIDVTLDHISLVIAIHVEVGTL